MTDVRPAPRSRENTRARLMDAASAVFAEVGLDAASVEAICERAGFTRGAFYSNFDSKNGLFLALVAKVTAERLDAVKARVAELEECGDIDDSSQSALEMVESVLDFTGDDRAGLLLMSEIRLHALRDPELAEAYLAQDEQLHQQVTQIIDEIADAQRLHFRLPADRAARLMLTAWEGAAIRAVMRGQSDEQRQAAVSAELARVAELVIEPASQGLDAR